MSTYFVDTQVKASHSQKQTDFMTCTGVFSIGQSPRSMINRFELVSTVFLPDVWTTGGYLQIIPEGILGTRLEIVWWCCLCVLRCLGERIHPHWIGSVRSSYSCIGQSSLASEDEEILGDMQQRRQTHCMDRRSVPSSGDSDDRRIE